MSINSSGNNNLTPSQALSRELDKPYFSRDFLDKFDLPQSMDLSAIVPTYNRCPFNPKKPEGKFNPLYWSLLSLISQRPKLREIIVINDNSQDYTKQVLKIVRKKAKAENVDFIVFTGKKRRGSSRARNIGVKRAKSNFIFFMDDDSIASKYSLFGAFFTLKKLSGQGVKVGAVHLPVYSRFVVPTAAIKGDRIARIDFVQGKFSSFFHRFPKEHLSNPEAFLDDKLKIFRPIQIQNLSGFFLIPKKRFLSVGGFPNFLKWKNSYGEETELACRLMANGYSLFFCPDPKFGLYHGKFGENSEIPINRKLMRKLKNKRLLNSFSLSELNKECAKQRVDTGNRVDTEQWYYSKIISFFVIFYPRNMKGALSWVEHTKRAFVETNNSKKFADGKWNVIEEKSKREEIWYRAILDGLELVSKRDKDEVWDFLRGLEEVRGFKWPKKKKVDLFKGKGNTSS